MKVILPLGRNALGVLLDVARWAEGAGRDKITSIVLVAAPNDQLEVPAELSAVAPVEVVAATEDGSIRIEPTAGMVVVVNGGTTTQQWAIAKWWWQMLHHQGSSYHWESYRTPETGSWSAVAVNCQRDGVHVLAHA